MTDKPRTPITEEMGIHKEWYTVKPTTPQELAEFATKLLTEYAHDYGTICHAAAAIAVAGAWVVDKDPAYGGLTGFQGGAIAHMFVKNWLQIEGPTGRVEYRHMLFPQHEKDFTKISAELFKWLQEEAAKELLQHPDAHDDVIAHWKSIIAGTVPFGMKLRD